MAMWSHFMYRPASGGTTVIIKHAVGTITAGDTHVHVTHEVGAVPSVISVTPADGLEAPIQVLEGSITDTEFVVQFVGGVTLESDAKFLWGAIK